MNKRPPTSFCLTRKRNRPKCKSLHLVPSKDGKVLYIVRDGHREIFWKGEQS